MFNFFKRLRINSIKQEKIPFLYDKNKKIYVKVIDVYDGDTVTLLYLLKNKIPIKIKLRIFGVDTPELSRKKDDKNPENILAEKIKKKIKKLLLNKFFYCKLYKFDKYGGRTLGDIYLNKNLFLSEYIIINKYGKKYNGNKKEKWSKEEIDVLMKEII